MQSAIRAVRQFAARALVIAVMPAALLAQGTGAIEGQIISSDGSRPLADVIVRLDGTPRAASTGADGRYRIAAVADGEYTVIARLLGHEEARRQVRIADRGTVTLNLTMRPSASIVAPVVVSTTRELTRAQNSTVTVDVLDGLEVRRTRAAHPSGLLNRVPGVRVSELSGEGHSLAMRSPITTKPLFLYLEDGIPTRPTGFFNHNALYEVNIPQSGGVEILKGPATALYGSDAIGGVVNVLTRPAPATPEAELAFEGGGFGYSRALGSAGWSRGTQGLRVDANVTRADNWKDAAPFDRTSLTLRHDLATQGGWTFRSVVAYTKVNQQDVPAINRTQFEDNRTLNRAPIAFRSAEALRASVAMEKESGATLWSITPFVRNNVMGLLPSWQLTFAPQIWDTRNRSAGLLAKVRRDFAPWQSRLVGGVDVDYSPGSFSAQRITVSPTGPNAVYETYTPSDMQYDYDVTYLQASPYVHFETSPLTRLRVDIGLRGDVSGYDYRTNLAPLATGQFRRPENTEVRYARVSPKLGAVYEFTPRFAWYGSFRQGFRAPSQGQLFQQNSAANTVDLKPVTVQSAETGLRGQLGARFAYQASVYDMTISNDILTFVTSSNTREATNAGETRAKGVELGVTAMLTARLRLDASYSNSSQRYVRWVPQAARPASGPTPAVPEVSYSGNLMEQAPVDLGNALLTWSPAALKGGRLAAEWSHTGRYAMDPGNLRTYGGHQVVHLHANAFVVPSVEVFARVTNLTGRAYAELASFDQFQGVLYTPGAPRTVYAGMRYGWTAGERR
jgi:outer membrane receptor protein involved in Fe transport